MRKVERTYLSRHQLPHRASKGRQETKKEAIERQDALRDNINRIKELKQSIKDKTGNEYFFKMNSTKRIGNVLKKSEKICKKEKTRLENFFNFEIKRIEKKLLKFASNDEKSFKINLETNKKVEIKKHKFGKTNSEEKEKYENYLKEIILKKQTLIEMEVF